MNIQVFSTHKNVDENALEGKIAIVIDVFRASTSIISALNNGCRSVIPVENLSVVNETIVNLEKDSYIIAGERNCIKMQGCTLGNSPSEFTPYIVSDKVVFLSTTNGTTAIKKARYADTVYIGGFVNLSAIVKACRNENKDIAIICSGTNGKFSLEDSLAAGAIINLLETQGITTQLNDMGIVSEQMYTTYSNDLYLILENCTHYKHLASLNLYQDIDDCLAINTMKILPCYKNGEITLTNN